MRKRMLLAVTGLCLVVATILGSGCGTTAGGGNTAQGQPVGAKADLELDLGKSAYPYLVFYNQGSASAQDVHVTDEKSGQELVPLGVLQKSGNAAGMQPAAKPLDVAPGSGAQMQLNSQSVLQYKVTWTEGGQYFTKELVMKAPQTIETH